MLERIQLFKEHMKQPIEIRNTIIKVMASQLSKNIEKNVSLKSVVTLKEELNKQKEAIEYHVFDQHFKNIRDICRNT